VLAVHWIFLLFCDDFAVFVIVAFTLISGEFDCFDDYPCDLVLVTKIM